MPPPGDQGLIEDLQLSDQQIRRRHELLRLAGEDIALLRGLGADMQTAAARVVGRFYDELVREPEVVAIVGGEGTLARLHDTMHHYVVDLFCGTYGPDYVRSRLRIGMAHQRLGIAPYIYISAVGLLQGLLEGEIDRLTPDTTAEARETGRRRKAALRKLLMLDMQLVLDTYIHAHLSAVDQARKEVQTYAASLEEKVVERTRQLYESARRDSLTGLYNQGHFYDLLHREVSSAARYRHPLSLVYIDLNDFKEINDQYGHRSGDAMLAHVGKVILGSIRAADLPCRYGGDEFCLVLPHTSLDQAHDLCRRLIDNFEATDTGGVTFSLGIAQIGPEHYADADTLVQWADARMYEAKLISRIQPGHHIRPECEPGLSDGDLEEVLSTAVSRVNTERNSA